MGVDGEMTFDPEPFPYVLNGAESEVHCLKTWPGCGGRYFFFLRVDVRNRGSDFYPKSSRVLFDLTS